MRPQLLEPVFAATAGNATKTYTNDTGEAIRFLYGFGALITDATVANRILIVAIKNAAGDLLADMHAGAVATASASWDFEFLPGIYRETSFINGALQVPLPIEMIVPPGGTVTMSVTNGVAGDSFSGRFLAQKLT